MDREYKFDISNGIHNNGFDNSAFNIEFNNSPLYGGDLLKNKDGSITLINPRFPSGKVIASWGNNHKSQGINSNIPLIFPGDIYKLKCDIEMDPNSSLILHIRMYRGSEEKIMIMHLNEQIIEFPSDFKFDSVLIELVNISNDELTFRNMSMVKVGKNNE
ncbi:accessory Sec system protein Asp3 [Weissella koreensis]|uniref:Accessory Sec system protein Asp3 n=1 Tax=Weissella koreensis TaxID=165096 RepID=A0A7H1MNG7_9LACO|nr:accessory Sec system protein Asp3 [Weissella koreensis]AVH74511.1 hypothetical protein C4597_00125 [Weissella koreensis]AVH75802.1 hypothetical protein C4597_07255 [Weissella koreensis]QGN19734.1 hypothetical protein GKC51_00090 [Weissella koreensis]QGN21021.1 hypothetical protein GKC51_07230 [Weissella koreensis]QNT63773.1 hypothetical protein FY536_00140 [Weissella koreensis]